MSVIQAKQARTKSDTIHNKQVSWHGIAGADLPVARAAVLLKKGDLSLCWMHPSWNPSITVSCFGFLSIYLSHKSSLFFMPWLYVIFNIQVIVSCTWKGAPLLWVDSSYVGHKLCSNQSNIALDLQEMDFPYRSKDSILPGAGIPPVTYLLVSQRHSYKNNLCGMHN